MSTNDNKKQKGSPRLETYLCTCAASTNKLVPLKLTTDRLGCVLQNYKVYMEKRGMWQTLAADHIRCVERNISLPNEAIETFKLAIHEEQPTVTTLINGNTRFKLYIVSGKNLKGLVWFVEYNCCKEFVEFINMHVYNDDLASDLKKGTLVFEKMKLCNF